MTYAGARSGGTEAALDSVLSFFEAIHYLKDHLGNDRATTVTKAGGDRLINSSPTLKLCGDLANGSKHLALRSTRTDDLATTITRKRRHRNTLARAPWRTASTWNLAASNMTALQIAKDAAAEWDRFLTAQGHRLGLLLDCAGDAGPCWRP